MSKPNQCVVDIRLEQVNERIVWDVEEAKLEFAGLSMQVATGSRYLGSFIGEATERDIRITDKVDDWVYSIKKLAGAAHDYPQNAYSALHRSVQQEWQYLQCTPPNIEACCDQLEKAMQEEFFRLRLE